MPLVDGFSRLDTFNFALSIPTSRPHWHANAALDFGKLLDCAAASVKGWHSKGGIAIGLLNLRTVVDSDYRLKRG